MRRRQPVCLAQMGFTSFYLLGERRMKKTISVVALASLVAASTAHGAAYRIPEQSADSTAKAGAHVASALGPDAAYYNPANMSWMDYESWAVDGNLSYIHLTEIEYDDDGANSISTDGKSKDENFLIPTGFLVSPDYNGVRFGFSIVAPFGLAKRWPAGTYAATFAEKFSLKVIEANPTVSYRFDDIFSVAFGVRALYSEATVMSNGPLPPTGGFVSASRYVDGDALDFGWNAALSLRPTEKSNVSFTFRSNVDLDFDGDVLLSRTAVPFPALPALSVSTNGDVSVPAPAVATISGSYTFDKLTVELTVDRTFWSAYKELDFEYDIALGDPAGILESAFDDPKAKDWEDTNAYRIGLAYQWSEELILMGGFAYDENPVPEETIGFDLPDSDAWIFSIGARYALSEKSEVAFGLLYDYKEKRNVTSADGNVDGEYSNASAIFATMGYTYAF